MPRRARGLPLPRRPRDPGERVAAAVVALAAAVLVVQAAAATWRAVAPHWPVALAAALAAGAGAGWRAVNSAAARRPASARPATLRITLAEFDAMGAEEFEYALRDLLIRDGWPARKVGRAGDQAADVIGDDARRGRIVVQAKHTRVGAAVGSSVMYEVKGTAGPVHRADHAVVVTNGGFTRDAKAWGDRHGVRWIDRELLRRWAEQGAPLADLLRLPPGPRRPPGRQPVRT
ncbi:restriction endonuclease [Streptomyces sp. NBC_00249]|uniref:restriction endonuclease n=1 Tax=Streptomyces sp. NBC_00249 TaxID=2975690 RepID=UPI00225A783F|nr:restriction endonuclease [Streptomyces sp. NBC_00249]MCX5195217.1 restriction endonuclease [Streptomyces sp. NBC_00249]